MIISRVDHLEEKAGGEIHICGQFKYFFSLFHMDST